MSIPSRLKRGLAGVTRAITAGRLFVETHTGGSGVPTRQTATESNVAITDGGGEKVPAGEDPEETPFVWGPTRERPNRGDPDRPPEESSDETFEAIEDRLDDLVDTVDHLSILATNVNLKLARDEPRDLAGIAYDVEADARALRRALAEVESGVERLRQQVHDPPSDRAGGRGRNRTHRTRQQAGGPDSVQDVVPRSTGQDRTVGDRPSVQLPASDRPNGPWRAAGVDLTNWPGHLGQVDFEQIKERIAHSETIATGGVPREVAEFSLDDREVTFDALLALASASDRIPPDPDGGTTVDEG